MRVQVSIIGAGSAGMFRALMFEQTDIDCVVLERRHREHVQGRVRAGVLERDTVELTRSLGLANRLEREGLVYGGTTRRSTVSCSASTSPRSPAAPSPSLVRRT